MMFLMAKRPFVKYVLLSKRLKAVQKYVKCMSEFISCAELPTLTLKSTCTKWP